jgi:hypothetical protein
MSVSGLRTISNELRPFVLMVASIFCWSMWLCRNEFVFEKKNITTPLQVIYLVINWLLTWIILHKATSQDLVAARCQTLGQGVKELFYYPST